ncbi:hypothetical protein ICE98_03751 [Lactococcus lactis]|nr:hypothetical protein [Lactococcus lactis]
MKTSDALIVIDMQNEVCAGIYRREELIEQINQRIITYRKAKKPIIFIQHNDDELIKESFGWQMIPELLTASTDKYVEKTHANGFYQTELQMLLEKLSVKLIEFWGLKLNFVLTRRLFLLMVWAIKIGCKEGQVQLLIVNGCQQKKSLIITKIIFGRDVFFKLKIR